jgi:hypothetical protein
MTEEEVRSTIAKEIMQAHSNYDCSLLVGICSCKLTIDIALHGYAKVLERKASA